MSGWVRQKCSLRSAKNWQEVAQKRLDRLRAKESGCTDSDLERWRYNPVLFADEALGVKTWELQAAVMMSVVEHHQVAVRSGHKIGKSLLIAILAIWWAVCWPDGKVLITAPTDAQIRDIVWSEVRKLAFQARKIGRIFVPEPAKDPSTGIRWDDGRRILGRSTDKPERIQGYSGPACLYLIDEASGVDRAIFEALQGNTAGGSATDTSAVAKFVLTGNPTQTSGVFYDAFHDLSDHWETFTISSEETPNAKTGEVVIPGLATRDYCEAKKAEWGEDSDLYRVRVRGLFPRQGGCTVVNLDIVEKAQKPEKDPDRHADIPYVRQLELGVDVARFGDDESAVAPRRGRRIGDLEVVSGFEEHAVAGMVINIAKRLHKPGEPRPIVKVDACGVGLGVASILRQYKRDGETEPWLVVVEVDSAGKANDEEQYPNRRSELWFAAESWLKEGGVLPDDRRLRADLTAPKYSFDERGRRVVEKKEVFKKRLGRSPDRADAVALAIYHVATSGAVHVPKVGSVSQSRYDGFRGFG